jgi:hypothetical protein
MSRRLPVLLATHTCFANSSKPCTCTNSIISTFVLAVVLMHTFTRRLRACLTHFIATVGTRAWYTNIQQDPFELAFTLEAFALTWHVARNMALLQGRHGFAKRETRPNPNKKPPACVFVLGWALLGHMHEYHAPVQTRSRLKRDIAVYIAFTRHRSSSYLSDIPAFVLAVVLMHTFTLRLRACLKHFIATVGTRAWYTNIQLDPCALASDKASCLTHSF